MHWCRTCVRSGKQARSCRKLPRRPDKCYTSMMPFRRVWYRLYPIFGVLNGRRVCRNDPWVNGVGTKVGFFLVQRLNERHRLSVVEIYNRPGPWALLETGRLCANSQLLCAEKALRRGLRFGTAIDQKAYAVLRGAFVSTLLSDRNVAYRNHVTRGLRRWRTPTRELTILMIRHPPSPTVHGPTNTAVAIKTAKSGACRPAALFVRGQISSTSTLRVQELD